MNKRKWSERAKHGHVPNSVWLAKLVEEVGEVGNAMLKKRRADVAEELSHVEFIARCFRENIERAT